ncbi:hypothetical protein EDC04DRAFT_1756709 [Pisolithus marmoratus]|nr:hypothetical protein EDC04DRAFT_1756709 [Pisolithus marmoratus]
MTSCVLNSPSQWKHTMHWHARCMSLRKDSIGPVGTPPQRVYSIGHGWSALCNFKFASFLVCTQHRIKSTNLTRITHFSMARKWLRKHFLRTPKPSNSDLPAGSSMVPAGDIAPDSQTSGNASRGSFARMRNFFHPSGIAPAKSSQGPGAESDLDPVLVRTQVDAARLGLDNMTPMPQMGQVAIESVEQANTAVTNIQSLSVTYLQPLKLFNSVVTNIANVHPYAQVALGILIAASKLIISQANLDSAISALVEKLVFVYELLLEEDTMKNIDDMKDTLAKVAQAVSVAAQFVVNYTETKNFY